MTWFWVKKWLAYKRRKAIKISKKVAMAESDSKAEMLSSLQLQATIYITDYGYIPLLLVNASFVIDRNIRTKGLFQTKGNNSKIVANLLTEPRSSKLKAIDVHDAIEVMKAFIVDLPSPVLPEHVCDSLIKASEKDSMSQYVFALREFRNMSPYNFAILHFMMRLLKKISEYSEHNCMDVRKLATIFVLDIIRPMEKADLNDGPFMAEHVQRLPFLITVAENLIQNVNMFKMVCSLDEASPSPSDKYSSRKVTKSRTAASPKAATKCYNTESPNQENTELWSENKENKIEEYRTYSVDQGTRNLTRSQTERSYKVGTSTVAASFSNMAITVCTSSRENINSLTDFATTEENNFRLNDFALEPEGEMLSNIDISPPMHETETTKRKKKKFLGVESMKSSTGRKKSKKVDKAQTTPDKKTSGSSGKKHSVSILKSRKGKSSSSKRSHCEQVEEELGSGRYFSMLQGNEDMGTWSNKSSDTDATSTDIRTVRCPKILLPKVPVTKKQDDVVDRETMTNSSTSYESQMFLANDGEIINSRDDLRTQIPDIGNLRMQEKDAKDALSHHIKMILSACGETSQMPEICVQYSSKEKKLASNNCHSGDIEGHNSNRINTSPCLKISLTSTNGDVRHVVSELNKETSFLKISASVEERKGKNQTNVIKSSKNTEKSHSSNAVGYDKNITDSTRVSASECNSCSRDFTKVNLSPQVAGASAADIESMTRKKDDSVLIPQRTNCDVETSNDHHQMILVTMRNNKIKVPTRLRHHRVPNQTQSSVPDQQSQNGHNVDEPPSERSTAVKWLVDIYLVGIMMFCICLLLHILNYQKMDEGWHQ